MMPDKTVSAPGPSDPECADPEWPGPLRPDLVIFDCDGVLVDSEAPTMQVLTANLARHGLAIAPEEAMRLFVGGTMAGVADTARALGADLPRDWVEGIYAEIYARLRRGVDAIPGVHAVLDALDAARIPACVASNGSDEKMDITLGATGLAARFAGRRFSAHALGVAKPDPGLFLIAARQMGVPPARCVVIEDSTTGARAARRAGMRCLGYAPHGDGANLSAEGARPFPGMRAVPALLGL